MTSVFQMYSSGSHFDVSMNRQSPPTNDSQTPNFSGTFGVKNIGVPMFPHLIALSCHSVIPLGNRVDKQFNNEFRVFFNRRFGPQNRLTRAQF